MCVSRITRILEIQVLFLAIILWGGYQSGHPKMAKRRSKGVCKRPRSFSGPHIQGKCPPTLSAVNKHCGGLLLSNPPFPHGDLVRGDLSNFPCSKLWQRLTAQVAAWSMKDNFPLQRAWWAPETHKALPGVTKDGLGPFNLESADTK